MSLLQFLGFKSPPWYNEVDDIRDLILEAFEEFIVNDGITPQERSTISVSYAIEPFLATKKVNLILKKDYPIYDEYIVRGSQALHERDYFINEDEDRDKFRSDISSIFSMLYSEILVFIERNKNEKIEKNKERKIAEEKASLFRDIINDSGLFENSATFTYSNERNRFSFTLDKGALFLEFITKPPQFVLKIDDVHYIYSLPIDFSKWADPQESELINSFIKNRIENA